MAVSEWGKSRDDNNFDVIAAQSHSLFRWILYRFLAVFGEAAVFAMLPVLVLRQEMLAAEMLLLYLSPALFLLTGSELFGVYFSQEHIATLVYALERV